jgi:hypothetical protein
MSLIVPFSKNRVVLNVTYYVTFPPKMSVSASIVMVQRRPFPSNGRVRVGIR